MSNQISIGHGLFTNSPNPLEKIFKEIPPNANRLDQDKLKILLNVSNKVKTYSKLSDIQLLEILSSYVSDPL